MTVTKKAAVKNFWHNSRKWASRIFLSWYTSGTKVCPDSIPRTFTRMFWNEVKTSFPFCIKKCLKLKTKCPLIEFNKAKCPPNLSQQDFLNCHTEVAKATHQRVLFSMRRPKELWLEVLETV